MVDVRMGKHQRFYFRRIKIKVAVFLKCLLPAALKHAAFKHYRVSVDRKKHHRPGDRLRSPWNWNFMLNFSPRRY